MDYSFILYFVVALAAFLLGYFCPKESGNRTHADRKTTIVYLRSTKSPAQHWEAKVEYDAWGKPYTDINGHAASFGADVLFPNGRTSDSWLYGTQWKHKSGPPVDFSGGVPADLFRDVAGGTKKERETVR